jgi:hypothetical protein
MANGEAIVAIISHLNLGNSDLVPQPINVEIRWVLGTAVSGAPKEGIIEFSIDPFLNANQLSAQLRSDLAAHLSIVTGVSYVANDVIGCTL